MSFGKRLKSAREAIRPKLTQAALGERLGVSAQAVSGWERDQDAPEVEKLAKIASAVRVSVDWLLERDHGGHLPSEAVLADDSPMVQNRPDGILEIDVRAGMGGGGTTEGREVVYHGNTADPVKEEAWHFPRQFMREEVRAPQNRVIVIETQGDSMSPTISSGDRVVVDTGHTIPSPDGIYAIRDQYGSIVVKRLQTLRRGDPPRIRIISDNKSHDAEDVGADEIAIVGRVLWGLKRL